MAVVFFWFFTPSVFCCCWPGDGNGIRPVKCFHLPSNRHNLSCGDRLEDKVENYQNCSLLYCVPQLYTVIRAVIMSSYYTCSGACWFRFSLRYLFFTCFCYRLRNDLYCVGWDVKPYSTQPRANLFLFLVSFSVFGVFSTCLFSIVSTRVGNCLERLASEMTYYMSSGTLNSTHLLTHSVQLNFFNC